MVVISNFKYLDVKTEVNKEVITLQHIQREIFIDRFGLFMQPAEVNNEEDTTYL